MYPILLTLHSLVRWLVLLFMLFAILKALVGFTQNKPFSRRANALRHWTATMAHIQLLIGMILFTQSPFVRQFWSNPNKGLQHLELSFYGMIHIGLMLTAITVLTTGSALAKRRTNGRDRFKTMLVYFSIALLLILVAIPWPFSPLSGRPYYRTF